MHRLIYQLTHHTLGSRDIAENPVLLDQTLAIYSGIDGTSAFQVMFPWLPTVGKFRKMWGGMRLHMLFSKIIKDRRKAGTKETDAMQVMVDAGDDELQISIASTPLIRATPPLFLLLTLLRSSSLALSLQVSSTAVSMRLG